MRASSRTMMTLNLFLGCVVLVLGTWMPEEKMVRMPLWLAVAAFTGILLDRRLDKRL